MSKALTPQEKEQLRKAVTEKYAQVAALGAKCCSFWHPTGRKSMLQQGYPPEIVAAFPTSILESFCGVGNPFSLGPLYPGETVLDIGCGGGVDSMVAARLVGPKGRVLGLDLTPEMVNRARFNLSLAGLDNVAFEVEEAEMLPFGDDQFDVAISNGVFNLIADKEQALREVYRVLKPGGRLLLADMMLMAELPEEVRATDGWVQWIAGTVPGKVFLALLLKVGFHRASLVRYTGLKSSPYTEGALFYGEKLVDGQAREKIIAQAGEVTEPVKGPECAPGTA